MTGYDKCSCNKKMKNKCTEIDDEPNTPPDIGFNFAMYHPPFSQEADGFQLLVDSGSSKHYIGPELIHGVESRMLEYTKKRASRGDNSGREQRVMRYRTGYLTSRSTRYRQRLEDSQICP